MAGIFINIEEARAFHIWENYFLGRPSAEGSVFMQGAFFYISRERIEIEGQVLKTPYGTVLSALDSESKSLFACREFLCGRRLPLGVTAAMTKQGISLFPDKLWSPGKVSRNGNRKMILPLMCLVLKKRVCSTAQERKRLSPIARREFSKGKKPGSRGRAGLLQSRLLLSAMGETAKRRRL